MNKYIYFAAVAVIVYFFQSFFLPTGGIGADSLSYFGIAADLPKPETNLFPLGYPVLLRFFQGIFHDYFWASKMLNMVMMIIILVFSYVKKFFFRETVLLFAGKTFFFVFIFAASEGPFLFCLYFLVYLFYRKLEGEVRSALFVFLASVLLFFLFAVRYSGIYIYIGVVGFYVMMSLKKNNFVAKRDILKVLGLAGMGILMYLLVNYFGFRSFTGEHLRGAPANFYPVYVLRDFLGITNVIDPFIGIKPASNSVLSIAFQVFLMLADFFVAVYFIKWVKRRGNFLQMSFHHFLWIVAGVYTLSLFVSGYFQQIEEMNVRMLAAANFCLFFSFLIIYFRNAESDRLIFGICCFFLLFLGVYGLKMPSDYFGNRRQIERQLPKYGTKKFLYNNEKEGLGTLTTYTIPLINKTFRYRHTNNQKGEIKQAIIGTLHPSIKWLKYDTVQDKSQVLYTSEVFIQLK